jgi:hypothetical protein
MRTGELTQMVICKYGAEFDKYHNKHVALTLDRKSSWSIFYVYRRGIS